MEVWSLEFGETRCVNVTHSHSLMDAVSHINNFMSSCVFCLIRVTMRLVSLLLTTIAHRLHRGTLHCRRQIKGKENKILRSPMPLSSSSISYLM
jgi:hypothetical protein